MTGFQLPIAPPTPDGFLIWVRGFMGVPASVLPDNSPYLGYAYDIAITTVNTLLAAAPNQYALAVYNLGGDRLVNITPDAVPLVVYKNELPYWAYQREAFKIYAFSAGVVQSASDEGTSDSLLVPDAFKGLTMSDLQNLKTPWGRNYLSYAQKFGSLWGLT